MLIIFLVPFFKLKLFIREDGFTILQKFVSTSDQNHNWKSKSKVITSRNGRCCFDLELNLEKQDLTFFIDFHKIIVYYFEISLT